MGYNSSTGYTGNTTNSYRSDFRKKDHNNHGNGGRNFTPKKMVKKSRKVESHNIWLNKSQGIDVTKVSHFYYSEENDNLEIILDNGLTIHVIVSEMTETARKFFYLDNRKLTGRENKVVAPVAVEA